MTNTYRYLVIVETDSAELADKVMCERIGPDEDYGFDYGIEWEPTPWNSESMRTEGTGR